MHVCSLIGVVMLSLLSLSACAGNPGKAEAPAAEAPANEASAPSDDPPVGPLEPVDASERRDLTFLNSMIFDRDLADAMRGGYRRIAIDVAGHFSLDVIPERMEKWLVAVQDSEGQVKAEALPDPDAPVTRSAELIALIEVAMSYYSRTRDKAEASETYAPSRDYHARLYYRRDTGNVTRVVFHRR